MRLLNARTLTLSSFFDRADSDSFNEADSDFFDLADASQRDIPRYVILSHTWGDEEVTFEDIKRVNDEDVQAMRGMGKIRLTCRQALTDGYDWVWIDTCCIDKSSSAELSEAINSMYDWYARAVYCYAYLEDFHYDEAETDPPRQSIAQTLQTEENHLHLGSGGIRSLHLVRDSHHHLRTVALIYWSRWFTRGWTLQELLAPKEVRFFSQSWTFLGTKQDLMLILVEKTGIPAHILADPSLISSCSISMRMTWMRDRQTTRREDLAYCLLGIFDVNMPLLYGEGSKAFRRLQKVILESSDDETLLTWRGSEVNSGLFATTPSDFRESFIPSQMTLHHKLPVLTSRGLTMKRDLYRPRIRLFVNEGTYMIKLNCRNGSGNIVCLLLSVGQIPETMEQSDIFYRYNCLPISEEDLAHDWTNSGARNLTVSWDVSPLSKAGRVYLQFTLSQEDCPGKEQSSLYGTTKLISNDLAHDITLRKRYPPMIEASTRYPSFGCYTCLFRFRLELARARHEITDTETLELTMEIDHVGTGSVYLEKQADQGQLTEHENLREHVQDAQEFMSLRSQRPIFQRTFSDLIEIQIPRFKINGSHSLHSDIAVDTSITNQLQCEEQIAQRIIERKERIKSAVADSWERQILSPAPPGLATTSFIKLQDSWLVVEVDRNDETSGHNVKMWRLLLDSREYSSISRGEILV